MMQPGWKISLHLFTTVIVVLLPCGSEGESWANLSSYDNDSSYEYEWDTYDLKNETFKETEMLPCSSYIHNGVMTLNLTNNPKCLVTEWDDYYFEKIILSHQGLGGVGIRKHPHLKYLDVSHNLIDDKSIINITNTIVELDLSANNFKVIRNSLLVSNPKLKRLVLSGNPINGLMNLSSDELEELLLDNTNLHYIMPASLVNLTRLRLLDLSDNRYFETWNRKGSLKLPALRHLKASNCDLKTLEIQDLPELEKLNVSKNHIREITNYTFVSNEKLSILDLSYNDITSVDSNAFINNYQLKEANLSHNNIEDIKFYKNLEAVQVLDVSSNKITKITYFKLTNLTVLNLSDNKIEEWLKNFDIFFPNITVLNLSKNNFKVITPLKSPTLQHLDLRSCKILVVEKDAFKKAPSLRSLSLSDNKIKKLDFAEGLIVPMNLLTLDDNPWDCTCVEDAEVGFVIDNSTFHAINVTCFPSQKQWSEFCAVTAQPEKYATDDSLLEKKSSDDEESFELVPYIVGIVAVVLFSTGIVLGLTITLKKKFKRKENKGGVDLLEPTRDVKEIRRYEYIAPPIEEVCDECEEISIPQNTYNTLHER